MSPLEPVTGGLLHAMYRLRTTNGRFAVKVLDANIVKSRRVRAEYARSESVAAILASGGVPAVYAREGKQGRLAEIGGQTVMVYPWIEGTMLSAEPAGPLVTRQIGSILAAIHDAEIDQTPFAAPNTYTANFGEWRQIVDEASGTRASWVDDIRAMVPDLMAWEMEAYEAADALGYEYVVSHRDLDQKNVLWSRRDTPAIVDWEGVGLVRPAVEVLSAALDWSGQKITEPDQYSFVALLMAYRATRPLEPTDCVLALKVLRGATGWLRSNIRRAIDTDRTPQDRAMRAREIVKYAQSLRSLASHLDVWAKWCDETTKPVARSA